MKSHIAKDPMNYKIKKVIKIKKDKKDKEQISLNVVTSAENCGKLNHRDSTTNREYFIKRTYYLKFLQGVP